MHFCDRGILSLLSLLIFFILSNMAQSDSKKHIISQPKVSTWYEVLTVKKCSEEVFVTARH